MLTIFTCPKKFEKKTGMIQTNAIKSWMKLDSKIQIIVIGNDSTIKNFAGKNHLKYLGAVRVNSYKTPYVDSIFKIAEKESKYDTLVYVNADIILFKDFLKAVDVVSKRYGNFLITGQRFDLKINKLVDFSNDSIGDALYKETRRKGRLHGYTGMDYFVFRKNTLGKIPKFLIGRDEWDNWMIQNALSRGLKTVDATKGITALHQNHDYSHLTPKKKYEEESLNNRLAKGKTSNMCDMEFALDSGLRLKRKSFLESHLPKLMTMIKLNIRYFYDGLINAT